MRDVTLIEITYVIDDETGVWRQGEIEHGIYTTKLESFLRNFGERGKNELLGRLEFMQHLVEKYWSNVTKTKAEGEEEMKDKILGEDDLICKLIAWADFFKYECSHSEEQNWTEKDEKAFEEIRKAVINATLAKVTPVDKNAE